MSVKWFSGGKTWPEIIGTITNSRKVWFCLYWIKTRHFHGFSAFCTGKTYGVDDFSRKMQKRKGNWWIQIRVPAPDREATGILQSNRSSAVIKISMQMHKIPYLLPTRGWKETLRLRKQDVRCKRERHQILSGVGSRLFVYWHFPGNTVPKRKRCVRRWKTFVHLTGKGRENPPVSVQSTEKWKC